LDQKVDISTKEVDHFADELESTRDRWEREIDSMQVRDSNGVDGVI
jgi:hypothetical protein